jgi:hypothetical protein
MTETASSDATVAATPWTWRASLIAAITLIAVAAYAARDTIGPRGQAVAGLFFFFGLVAAFSSNLRAVNWRTIGWGIALQAILALLVLRVPIVKEGFEAAKAVVVKSSPSRLKFIDVRSLRQAQSAKNSCARTSKLPEAASALVAAPASGMRGSLPILV